MIFSVVFLLEVADRLETDKLPLINTESLGWYPESLIGEFDPLHQ